MYAIRSYYVEQIGTYPLPESQLDRFLITTGIGYPPAEVEKSIIQTGSIREEIRHIEALLALEDILEAKRVVREEIYLSAKVTDYIFALIAATRAHEFIQSGLSTRGGINLATAARAAAFRNNFV